MGRDEWREDALSGRSGRGYRGGGGREESYVRAMQEGDRRRAQEKTKDDKIENLEKKLRDTQAELSIYKK
ncbi:hypothetical protein ACFL1H_06640 [Nanoarchaeota archaeon]